MTRRNTTALIAAIAIASMSLIPTVAAADGTDSASADASCEIMQPIALLKVDDLQFGTIISSGVQGTITIGTGSDAATPAGGAAIYVASGPSTRAEFTVSGEPDAQYSVSYPASVELVNSELDTMDAVLSCNLAADTGTLDGSGDGSFFLGGVLTVGANQPSGDYTVNFNVSVDYL